MQGTAPGDFIQAPVINRDLLQPDRALRLGIPLNATGLAFDSSNVSSAVYTSAVAATNG